MAMTVDEYIASLFIKDDQMLGVVNQSILERGLPMISVPPEVGQLLTLLVKMSGAKQLLEIGALAGYSGICLARGLTQGGHLTSLELSAEFAAIAHANLSQAGFGDIVTYYVGEALNTLHELETQNRKFDLFFIDADKGNYPNYLEYAIRLSNPGAMIIADNVLRDGRVLDELNQQPSTVSIRTFNERLAADERLEAMLLPLGDGLTIARVRT